MGFEDYLKGQACLHRAMQPADIIKLCYQAAFGSEHLLSDVSVAKIRFDEEFLSVEPDECELYEQISHDIYRINLAGWKSLGIPGGWLFKMFYLTSIRGKDGSNDEFIHNLSVAERLVETGIFTFALSDWRSFREKYEENGSGPIHHSEPYRECEKPSYRIVRGDLVRLIPLLKAMSALSDEGVVRVVAIDGRAASGKTTIASQLESIVGAGIIHTDDFFLPGELRVESRFATPGGNFHYERFLIDIMPFLREEKAFSYPIFDCGRMDFVERRQVIQSGWRIVEGAYSSHPELGEYMDILAFSDITAAEQLSRIRKRNGEQMAEIFASRWIPLEEQYFNAYKTEKRSNVIL